MIIWFNFFFVRFFYFFLENSNEEFCWKTKVRQKDGRKQMEIENWIKNLKENKWIEISLEQGEIMGNLLWFKAPSEKNIK